MTFNAFRENKILAKISEFTAIIYTVLSFYTGAVYVKLGGGGGGIAYMKVPR